MCSTRNASLPAGTGGVAINTSLDFSVILALVVAVSGACVAVSISNWREGLMSVMVVGVIQDPLRKLVEGTPSMFILWCAAIFAFASFTAWQRRGVAKFSTLFMAYRPLAMTWAFFAFVLVTQCLNSLFRFGPVVPILGMVEYVIPLFAILVGIGFANKPGYGERFMWRYVLLVTPIALSVYLSVHFSDDWDVLKDVGYFSGSSLEIFDFDTVVESYSGLFRTGEVAAWHAATAAMFLIILAQSTSKKWFVLVASGLVVLLVGAILYTGRRKMLMALPIFAGSYMFSLVLLKANFRSLIFVALPVVFIGFFLALNEPDTGGDQSVHLMRGATVYKSAGDRVDSSLGMLESALFRSYGVGLGVGVYAQGARYAGVDLDQEVGSSGEAGIGKVVLELGVIGAITLVLMLVLSVWRAFLGLKSLVQRRDPSAPIACGIASFIVAQFCTFAVATQLYGDPFILTVLGMTSGILMSLLLRGLQKQPGVSARTGVLRPHVGDLR